MTFSSLTVSAYEIFIEAKHLHNPIILSKQEQHERGAEAHLSKQTADRWSLLIAPTLVCTFTLMFKTNDVSRIPEIR